LYASLSIDLDGLELYHRIHGMPDPPPGEDPVYGAALQRFGELCRRLGLRGTAFCVGASLGRSGAAAGVKALAAGGHEIANHSLSHDYALSRRSRAEIAAEVRGGAEAIARATGRVPLGFRAPGYTLSPRLVEVLAAEGYRYDSSAFPALPYYLGKAAVMALLRARGRPSAAVLDRPRVLLAPRRPYRPRLDEPYAPGRGPLLELPVTTGLLGFPLIGTFVATLPRASRLLSFGTGQLPLVNLELHGLDLLDRTDCPGPLAARRRDLRVPAAAKIRRIEAFVRAAGGREWVTLAEAAERLAPTACGARLGGAGGDGGPRPPR
jgi:hypothetical protein